MNGFVIGEKKFTNKNIAISLPRYHLWKNFIIFFKYIIVETHS